MFNSGRGRFSPTRGPDADRQLVEDDGLRLRQRISRHRAIREVGTVGNAQSCRLVQRFDAGLQGLGVEQDEIAAGGIRPGGQNIQ